MNTIEYIEDYITGEEVPYVGSEGNRQEVERYLVERKGYARSDIEVSVPIEMEIAGEPYRSTVDLVLSVDGKRFMIIKCAAASLGSREREAVFTARLLEDLPLPFAAVSDGCDAIILDTTTGKPMGEGMDAIFIPEAARKATAGIKMEPIPEARREREKLVFRTYDLENVNTAANLSSQS